MLLDPGHCTLAPRAQVLSSTREAARQSSTFVLLTHPEKLGLADGHGNVPPDPSAGGQHWSPAHMLLDPGHCTLAPRAQVFAVVVVVVVVVVVARQSSTFVLLTHPEKLGLADGHGNVPPDPSADGHGNVPPDPNAGGQHWSPAHMLLDPGHCTLAPGAQVFAVVVVVVVVVVVARQSSQAVVDLRVVDAPRKAGTRGRARERAARSQRRRAALVARAHAAGPWALHIGSRSAGVRSRCRRRCRRCCRGQAVVDLRVVDAPREAGARGRARERAPGSQRRRAALVARAHAAGPRAPHIGSRSADTQHSARLLRHPALQKSGAFLLSWVAHAAPAGLRAISSLGGREGQRGQKERSDTGHHGRGSWGRVD
ncbi:unnamed protein product [Prorocentrum cordatum]|uniref:Uncharacterized protein n=1 Tax=Prorocentrum cordatum TaxID=2364126 RepID=A0ABN9XFP0_9DINO|nr:unnamed protein product [Polarella glacialis]